jgi:hypothetical protein
MTKKLATVVLGLVLVVGLAVGGLGATGITQAERTQAIQQGLGWLLAQQQISNSTLASYGSFVTKVAPSNTELAYTVAQTALALYKLESYALHAGVSPLDPTWSLSNRVVAGWKYVMTKMHTDANGIYFDSANGIPNYAPKTTYETALVMLALQASSAPNMPIPASPSQTLTFFDVLKGCVDWVSSTQETTGGWEYSPSSTVGADMSICRWAVEGLMAAEAWGIAPPNYVKSRLMAYLTALQEPISGGFGYRARTDITVPTPPPSVAEQTGYFATTAAGLIGLSYCGVDTSDPRWTSAAAYICRQWSKSYVDATGLVHADYFNMGNIYAMYDLASAALLANPQEVWDFCGHEWQPEYDRWLVDHQDASGSWDAVSALPWHYTGWSKVLATEYALLILEKDAPIPYDPLTSFEDLLRRQANALLSFETLLKTNWSALGWTERMSFLKSFEFLLREQAERIESFENLLHAASDRLTDLQRTNFAKSFEDLLKRQAKLLASFEELLEKVAEPGLPHIDWDHVFEQEPQAK